MTGPRHGNRQKHLTPNPAQRFLLDRFHHKITHLIQQTNASHLLDAGCGEGFGLEHFQQQLPQLTITGGDYSFSAMQWGLHSLNFSVPLVNFDIHHLPFADNSFPLVTCLEVMEHLPDSSVGLAELARVSSEYIVCSVPHEPWFRGANFLRGKHITAFGNDPEHLHNYTGRSFRQMAGRVIDILWHGYSFPWQIILGRKQHQ